MATRIASLVCCFGLIMVVRKADAQTPSNGSAAPTAATPGPTPPPPAVVESGHSTETDGLGRSLWWPAAPDSPSQSPSSQGNANQGMTRSEQLLPFQQGLLFLPYVGLSIPLGDDSGSYTVGHSFGALVGAHLGPVFSLNAEINVDYMNPGPLATETQTDFALSPLLQSRGPRHFLVLGMKLGIYSFTRSVSGMESYSSRSTTSYSTTGTVWGLTFGGFVPVGPMAFGCLSRLTFRNHSSNCGERSSGTLCNDDNTAGISPAFSTFNFLAAALF
jgi:hypothetical protein